MFLLVWRENWRWISYTNQDSTLTANDRVGDTGYSYPNIQEIIMNFILNLMGNIEWTFVLLWNLNCNSKLWTWRIHKFGTQKQRISHFNCQSSISEWSFQNIGCIATQNSRTTTIHFKMIWVYSFNSHFISDLYQLSKFVTYSIKINPLKGISRVFDPFISSWICQKLCLACCFSSQTWRDGMLNVSNWWCKNILTKI